MTKVRGLIAAAIGSTMLFTLLIGPVQAAAPGNNRIADATTISVTSNAGSASFTTEDATRQSGEYLGPNSAFQNTVWYVWTPSANQQATISNCSASTPTDETRLFVYELNATTSAEPTSAPTKGTSSNCTNGNSISIMVSSTKVYYIQVVAQRTATGTVSISTVALPSYTQLTKVTICHRTHATTNPYRLITVSVSSIVDSNSAPNGHALHNTDARRLITDGPAGVFRPTYSYPSNAKHWGDIIPPFQTAGGGIFEGLNWSWPTNISRGADTIFDRTEFAAHVASGGSTDGQAAVAYCTGSAGNSLTARQFFENERAAGEDQADVLADLDEQAADEDDTIRTSLGGSFSTPTGTTNLFPRPVRPTVTAARKVIRTESTTVVFDVNINESVTGISTSDFTTSGTATGCSVTAVSASSGTSVEVTVVCASTGTVKISVVKDGLAGATDVGPATAVDSTETEIFANSSPSASPSPSVSPSSPGNSSATPARGGPLYKGNKAPKQSLSGVVWADLNQNGTQEDGEPNLADVTCTCQLKFLTSAFSSNQRFATGVSAPRYAVTSYTVKTNTKGQYLLKSVSAGEWTTTCTAPTGMTVTYDSTDTSDGVMTASVPSDGSGFTWVGLVGSSTISAPVTDPSGNPAEGEVVLTWDGPDGKPGTKDDVNFVTEAINGEINLSGLPAGNYRIRSIDGTSVTASLKISSGVTFQNALFTKKSSNTKLADTGINQSLGLLGLGLLGFAFAMFGSIGLTRQRKSNI